MTARHREDWLTPDELAMEEAEWRAEVAAEHEAENTLLARWSEPDLEPELRDDAYDERDPYDRLESEGGHL